METCWSSVRHPSLQAGVTGCQLCVHLVLHTSVCFCVAAVHPCPHTVLASRIHSELPRVSLSAYVNNLTLPGVPPCSWHIVVQTANPAIIHRDLKSSNILIDASGQARICDFGLARHKMLLYESQHSPRDPAGGIMRGTYGYMSPEYAESGMLGSLPS